MGWLVVSAGCCLLLLSTLLMHRSYTLRDRGTLIWAVSFGVYMVGFMLVMAGVQMNGGIA